MDLMKTLSCYGALLALLGSLLSCAPARTKSIRNFVPPSPADGVHRIAAAPPPIQQARFDLGDTPRFLSSAVVSQAGARVETLLEQADLHFREGRRLYQTGDENGARREFDRAVDLLLSGPETASLRGPVDRKLEELIDAIHRLDLAGSGVAETDEPLVYEKPPLEDIPPLTFPVDPKLKDKVDEELRATASQLPLATNAEVLSYVNYFTTERGRRILISGLRRAGRYRPLIQRILDEEGVPQELIFLAQAESGFMPRAVSRAKAMGMWQFMSQRGREYGLERTEYRDDRFDPERSTRAAARHLRDLYHRYGDWYLAMAAYNCGPGVVDRAVERTGYADFFELRRLNTLPRESSNYVPAILAMTIMVKNAREYGLENLESEPPLEFDTVEIAAPTSLALIADVTECPIPELRDLNPALLRNVAPGSSSVRVPKGSGAVLSAAVEAVPAANRVAWRAHRVAGGDTMTSIAKRYRVREDSIMAVNRTGSFAPGELLVIPAAPERERVLARGGKKRGGSKHLLAAASGRHAKTSVTSGRRPARSAVRSAGKASTPKGRTTAARAAARPTA